MRARFTAIVILDGSRLTALAHRLKLLWNERAVVLPGCLLGGVADIKPVLESLPPRDGKGSLSGKEDEEKQPKNYFAGLRVREWVKIA